jgi:AAA domain
LIKLGQIALPDAIDSLYEIAEASGLCASLGAEFVYEDIQRQLTAGPAEESEERPDYAPRVVSVKDLQTMTFPPMRYVLPGLIPEGLTILAARPKAKKSWLMLDLAVAVAAGRFLLGDLKPAEGDVLYLALEDSHRFGTTPPTSKAPDRPDFHRGLGFARRFTRKGQEIADRLRRLG